MSASASPGAPDALLLPASARDAFTQGEFAWLGVRTAAGPHVTPLVFAFWGDRLWVTTARDSVKARRWKRDRVASGLVRGGGLAVSFTGDAVLHDALDPGTWLGSITKAPLMTMATAEFMRKNARFFAGYARDARKIPLAWTPPGRVFVEIVPQAGVVSDATTGEILTRWGSGRRRASERPSSFRATRATRDAFDGVPADVARAIGSGGSCAIGVGTSQVPVIAGRWLMDDGACYVGVREELAGLAGGLRKGTMVGVTIDHASSWRASDMAGVLLQGDAKAYSLRQVRTGARGLRERLERMGAGDKADDWLLVRVQTRRLVWWRGWSAGTVRPV